MKCYSTKLVVWFFDFMEVVFMKKLLIIFLFISFSISARDYNVNQEGDLVINNVVYQDILEKGSNIDISLTSFNHRPSLSYFNVNGFQLYFVFDKNNKSKIDCVFNQSRNSYNGLINRNSVCGLNISIKNIKKDYSKIIDSISYVEDNFKAKRNNEGAMEVFDTLSIEKFKSKNSEVYLIYDDFLSYIDGMAKVKIVDLNDDKVIISDNFYFMYIKEIGEKYILKEVLLMDSKQSVMKRITIK